MQISITDILAALAQLDHAASLREIANALELSKHQHKQLRPLLKELARQGRVRIHQKLYEYIPETSLSTLGVLDASAAAQGKGYGFIIFDDHQKDAFVALRNMGSAEHGDQVEVELSGEKDRPEASIQKVVQRKRSYLVGDLVQEKGKFWLIPDEHRLIQKYEVIDCGKAQIQDKVVADVVQWGIAQEQNAQVKISEILGRSGTPEADLLAVIRTYQLPEKFSDEVLQETETIEVTPAMKDGRKTLQDLFTFTIDPATAKDFDDAISIQKEGKGWRLWVHIADVSAFVEPGSTLDAEAVQRGNSYYLLDTVLPMLPQKLSNQLCSLRPHEEKLTMTAEFLLNADGGVEKTDLYAAIINSDFRLNYEQVDRILEGQEECDPQLKAALQELDAVTAKLMKLRKLRGSLDFDLGETEFELDENGVPVTLFRMQRSPSHRLIEESMLLANEHVARLLFHRKLPAIYRVHEQPAEDKLEHFFSLLKAYGIWQPQFKRKLLQSILDEVPRNNLRRIFEYILLRSLKRAKYSAIRREHSGLALDFYAHFTSPIRRYADLTVHRQLKHLLYHKKFVYSQEELMQIARHITQTEVTAFRAESDISRKKIALFAQKLIGEKFNAIVTDMSTNTLRLELAKFPLEGILPIDRLPGRGFSWNAKKMVLEAENGKRKIRLGDRLRVKISRIVDDKIEFDTA